MPTLTSVFPTYINQSVAFSTAVRFDKLVTVYASHTVAGAISFTVNSTGAIPGAKTFVRLVANGTNVPVFTGFKLAAGAYRNIAATVNTLEFQFDGTDYWYRYLDKPEISGLSSYPDGAKVLFIDGGQSNIVGNTNAGTFSGTAPTTSRVWNKTTKVFDTIVIGTTFRNTNSPILHMAAMLERDYPNLNFYFIDAAEGGTGMLREDGATQGYGPWGEGQYLRRDLTSQVREGLAAMTGNFYLQGFIWGQGEADSADLTYATGYEQGLKDWYTEIRSLTHFSLPIYTMRLNTNATYAFTQVTRAAQQASGTIIIDTDDITMHTDNVHYPVAGYTEIGSRLASAARFIQGVLVGSGGVSLPTYANTVLSGTTGLPSGWTSANVNLASTPEYLGFAPTGAAALGTNYIFSPLQPFNKPLEIGFINVAGTYAVGVTANPVGWDLRVALDTIALVKTDTTTVLYYGNIAVKSNFPVLVNAAEYKLRLTKFGKRVFVELLQNISTVWTVVGFYTIENAATTITPRVFYDAQTANPRGTFVKNDDYKLDIQPEVRLFARASDNAREAVTFAQYKVLQDLVTALKTTSKIWTYIDWLWFPVGPTLRPALRAIKHPNGSGYLLGNEGTTKFQEADWAGGSLGAAINVAFLDTGMVLSGVTSTDSHLMCMSETAGVTALSREVGGELSVSLMLSTTTGTASYSSLGTVEGANSLAMADSDGILVGSKIGTTARIVRDSTQLGTATVAGNAQTVAPERIIIFRNSRKRLSGASGGKGFPSPGVIFSYTAALAAAKTARLANL